MADKQENTKEESKQVEAATTNVEEAEGKSVEANNEESTPPSEETQAADNPNMKWYIVKGTSGREKSTAELIKQRIKANELSEKIGTVIVPTQEKVVIKKGKKDTTEERIFPGYILIQMEIDESAIHIIRNTDGVQGFIGWSAVKKQPRPISDDEVKAIVEFTKVQQQPTFQAKFIVGDAVKVSDGPFKDFVGSVQDVNEAKGQVSVLLSIFGRETPVKLDFLQVSKI